MASYYAPAQGQAGLEVVHHADLEVVSQQRLLDDLSLPQVRPMEDLQSTPSKQRATPIYTEYPECHWAPEPHLAFSPVELPGKRKPGPWTKRLWLIIGVAVAVVVILGAVLGGVLGSRAAANSSESLPSETQPPTTGSSTGSGDSTSSNTTKPQIRQGSSLSVTGWRRRDGSAETYLFFQGPDDGLRYSRCDTALATPGDDLKCWTPPVRAESMAIAGTQLGAATIVWGDEYQPQIELFYAGLKTRLLGVNFNENRRPIVSQGSISHLDVYTHLNSGIAAYWPWIVYQDAQGALHQLRNLVVGEARKPNNVDWDNYLVNITALPSSRLAAVPAQSNSTHITSKGGYAIFYQDTSSRLAVTIPDLRHPQLKPGYRLSWPVALPQITLPPRSPIAAFSVARANDPVAQRVDTYVLHLDEKGENIDVLYSVPVSSAAQSSPSSSSSDNTKDNIAKDGTNGKGQILNDDETGVEWRRAKPDAFRGVDKDTDITCVNMATTWYNAAKEMVLLEEAAVSRTRCYFQRGGRVVEVRLDVSKGVGEVEWLVVGDVPIPV